MANAEFLPNVWRYINPEFAPGTNVPLYGVFGKALTIDLGFNTATKLGTSSSPPSMLSSRIVARKKPMVA